MKAGYMCNFAILFYFWDDI